MRLSSDHSRDLDHEARECAAEFGRLWMTRANVALAVRHAGSLESIAQALQERERWSDDELEAYVAEVVAIAAASAR